MFKDKRSKLFRLGLYLVQKIGFLFLGGHGRVDRVQHFKPNGLIDLVGVFDDKVGEALVFLAVNKFEKVGEIKDLYHQVDALGLQGFLDIG